ncbi:hypothetical protein FPQ18DRAFT_91288 [Pyronema domesticum]|nr:hypothetical protein FPQ18DRAFT_91288 [Pyronema domesticum]
MSTLKGLFTVVAVLCDSTYLDQPDAQKKPEGNNYGFRRYAERVSMAEGQEGTFGMKHPNEIIYKLEAQNR